MLEVMDDKMRQI